MLRDGAADLGGACEGHLVDIRMVGECRPDEATAASERVEHALRQVLVAHGGEQQDREGRVIRRLQHDGVAGGERRGNLEPGDHERGVPRQDRGDDAERFAARVLQLVVAGGQRDALHFAGDTGEVAEQRNKRRRLRFRLRAQRVAGVERGEPREVIRARFDLVGDERERPGALGEVGGPPAGERGFRRGDREVDIFDTCRGHARDHGAPPCRVEHVAPLPRRRFDRFAVDPHRLVRSGESLVRVYGATVLDFTAVRHFPGHRRPIGS